MDPDPGPRRGEEEEGINERLILRFLYVRSTGGPTQLTFLHNIEEHKVCTEPAHPATQHKGGERNECVVELVAPVGSV